MSGEITPAAPTQAIYAERKEVADLEHVDNADLTEAIDMALAKGQPVLMKSSMDRLSTWQALKAYKRVSAICMIAAFSASLDGYQINLNGSIVSNTGFIHLMSGPKATANNPTYVSAWGGLQAVGQVLGQVTLQYATDTIGRMPALYLTWIVLVASVITESLANDWQAWLGAKLLAGTGVGMLQATLPTYIAEHAPTQLRGFLINSYSFWFVVGQLLAPVALQRLNAIEPTNFRIAIYTQWGMIGGMLLLFFILPESPWWLVSKGKLDRAEKILTNHNGHIEGYNVKEEIAIMVATIERDRQVAKETNKTGTFAIFKGTNGWRLLIALWPKLMQYFVGLSVFNTYSTYFFQLAGNKNPFNVTIILACVQLISIIVVCTFTDSYGRRPMTVYGYTITVISVLCLGIVGCFNYKSASLGSLLIFFACVAIFSTTGSSAIAYAYLNEIPTQDLRARTAGWGLAITNLFSVMFQFCVPLMIAKWVVKTGFFFAGTGIVVCVVGWFIIPEVAKRTPAEIDEMFEKHVPPRQFKNYKTEVQINWEEKERVEAQVAEA